MSDGPIYYLFHEKPPLRYKGPHPLRQVFIEAIEALDEDDRIAIDARFWENLTYREIADRVGLNAKQSGHYRVQRALARLKEELEKKGVTYE